MNENEIKTKYPELYASIFNAGITAGVKKEVDRFGAFMVFHAVDAVAVTKAIDE